MRFSKIELMLIEQIADGNNNIKNIAKTLGKSKSQIYRLGKKLIEKGFIEISHGAYNTKKITPAILLMQLLHEYPLLIEPLSGSGIRMLSCILEPKSLSDIIERSGIKRTQLFKKIKQARAISLVRRKNKKYCLNEKLWIKAIDFLNELRKYEQIADARIPTGSLIYYKNDKEIIFSSNEVLDATLTAFSAYEGYGIKVLSKKRYYYLPNKKLTKENILKHSLYVAEKELEIKQIILVALLYIKFKTSLSKVKHIILSNINKILEGKYIPGYPTLKEIRERAELYDIKI